jgi:hypothetical protein
MIRRIGIAVAALFVGVMLACSKDGGGGPTGSSIPQSLASCSAAKEFFTQPPFAISAISGWVPLGNLNPPAHTFPTDHQYIYLKSAQSTPLVAPGTVAVTRVSVTKYLTAAPFEDYAITFQPCREVAAEFGHVRTLSPTLASQVGAIDQQCNTYSPAPGQTVTQCTSKRIAVTVAAGAPLGTASGLDLSLFDNRVAPIRFANDARWQTNTDGFDRFHVVAFSDYYAEPARSAVRSVLGSFDGKTLRTVEPVGGTIATDVAGTAQGAWFFGAQPTYPESPHLAIVPDQVTPTRIGVSLGTSHPNFAAQSYGFDPVTNGYANRDPSQVTVATGIVCWELNFFSGTGRVGAALVQLMDAKTLRLEIRPGESARCALQQPYAFGPNAVTYTR